MASSAPRRGIVSRKDVSLAERRQARINLHAVVADLDVRKIDGRDRRSRGSNVLVLYCIVLYVVGFDLPSIVFRATTFEERPGVRSIRVDLSVRRN